MTRAFVTRAELGSIHQYSLVGGVEHRRPFHIGRMCTELEQSDVVFTGDLCVDTRALCNVCDRVYRVRCEWFARRGA